MNLAIVINLFASLAENNSLQIDQWKSFARTRIYVLLIFYALNFALFIYATVPNDQPKIQGAICTVIGLSSVFLITEIRQMVYFGRRYFWSPFNWIDLAAFLLTLCVAIGKLERFATSSQDVTSSPIVSPELSSIAILLLWVHLVGGVMLCFEIFFLIRD